MMNQDRRSAMRMLLSGATLGLGLYLTRSGWTYAGRLVAHPGRNAQPEPRTPAYGYREINIS